MLSEVDLYDISVDGRYHTYIAMRDVAPSKCRFGDHRVDFHQVACREGDCWIGAKQQPGRLVGRRGFESDRRCRCRWACRCSSRSCPHNCFARSYCSSCCCCRGGRGCSGGCCGCCSRRCRGNSSKSSSKSCCSWGRKCHSWGGSLLLKFACFFLSTELVCESFGLLLWRVGR